MPRVLVTGGAGFIGSHTVDRLVKMGYSVRIIDDLHHPVHPNRQLPNWLNCECEYVVGDIRSYQCWEQQLRDVDYVLHLAAYQDYQTDFSTFFSTNAVGTALLYETIVAWKFPIKKVVIASSQAVYGEGAYFCSDHGVVHPAPRTEEQLQDRQWDPTCPHCPRGVRASSFFHTWTDESRVNPHNAYAISKYTQEQIGMTLGRRYEIPTTALRYSIVQGPRQSFHNAYSGLLRRFTLDFLQDQLPMVYEDGNQIRDYVSVFDVVDANILALQDYRTDYEVFNVGGDRRVSVNDYYELLATTLGQDPESQPNGHYRFGDTRHVISDVSKLKALGWEPKVTLREIIDGYVAWARSQPLPPCAVVQANDKMYRDGVVRKVSF